MNKQTLLATLVAAGVSSAAAQAAPEPDTATSLKQGATFTGSALAGAVLGGPVGMLAGGLAGAYLAEQIERAGEADDMQEALMTTQIQLRDTREQLQQVGAEAEQVQQLVLDILDTRVLFDSGADELNAQGKARIEALARVLRAYPGMRVRLDGHADPRGTDEYNNVLSQYRARTVRDALLAEGVPAEHIELHSHGADRSRAAAGDADAYAAERRVDIQVTHPRRSAVVMN